MRNRLVNMRDYGVAGFIGGFTLGHEIMNYFGPTISNQVVHFVAQLDVNDEISTYCNSTPSISNNLQFQQIQAYSSAEMLVPWTCGLVGGMTGAVCGMLFPSGAELRDSENTGRLPIQAQAPLIVENKLQNDLEICGYQGKIPDPYRDPVLWVLMDEPYILLTTHCYGEKSTASTFNLSTLQEIDKKILAQRRCPKSHERYTGYIPNKELKQAILAWFDKKIAKAKQDNKTKDQKDKVTNDNNAIPSYYLDPKTKKLMNDPCILLIEGDLAPSSYDRSTILLALKQENSDLIPNIENYRGYIPNRALQESIILWKEKVTNKNKASVQFGLFNINENQDKTLNSTSVIKPQSNRF